MTDTLAPVSIKRRQLGAALDSAWNHLIHLRMIGVRSTTADDLLEVLLDLPCLYCGETNLVHLDSCDREFWRDSPKYEQLLTEYEPGVVNNPYTDSPFAEPPLEEIP